MIRKGLVDAGPVLYLVRDEVARSWIEGFRTPHDAAVVAILQACACTERPEFARSLAEVGETATSDPKGRAPQALGELATNVERLFREIVRQADPGFDDKSTLAESLAALRAADLLPLQPDER